MSSPAIFLDRDGTINVEKEYLYRVEDWEWIPGAVEAIKLINQMGWLVIVVTNQAGVARGYYTEDDVDVLHRHVDKLLAVEGAKVNAYYYCPHHPEFGDGRECECRKPNSGMLLAAGRYLDIDLGRSYLIGDKSSDIDAAQNVGVTPIIVMTGYGRQEADQISDSVMRADDILDAVKRIFSNEMST